MLFRSIIFQDKALLLVQSTRFGEVKFPGGGIEIGESHRDALRRETLEETGYAILPTTIAPYGKTIVMRKGFQGEEIFHQVSFYYTCNVSSTGFMKAQPQDGYETDYGYHPVFCEIKEAIEINRALLGIPQIPWVPRDLAVFEELETRMVSF